MTNVTATKRTPLLLHPQQNETSWKNNSDFANQPWIYLTTTPCTGHASKEDLIIISYKIPHNSSNFPPTGAPNSFRLHFTKKNRINSNAVVLGSPSSTHTRAGTTGDLFPNRVAQKISGKNKLRWTGVTQASLLGKINPMWVTCTTRVYQKATGYEAYHLQLKFASVSPSYSRGE